MSTLSGIVTCYDAKSGKEHWRERLGGQFSSSPIAIGSLACYQSEGGETVVIDWGLAKDLRADDDAEMPNSRAVSSI